jgi:hypothetical protein
MSLIERAPERYTLWVCEDCAQPAHGPGDRCSKDRRRTWTRMDEVEYVRADLHEGVVEMLREIAEAAEAQVEKLDPAINSAWVAGKARDAIECSERNRSDAPG